MDVKTLLGITSAVVGAGIVVAQDPSFEYPPVQPILTSGKPVEELVQDKKITVRFKQASVEEVLDWLSNQGVNFVTSGIPKDAKINLNISDTPLSEVIEVVGHSLGGSFVKRGNTYVFQRGNGGFTFDGPMTFMKEIPRVDLERVKNFEGQAFAMPEGFTFKMLDSQDPKSQKEIQKMHEEIRKEFGPNSDFMKKLHKELGDAKKWESLHKDFGIQHERNAKLEAEMAKRFGDGSAFQKELKARSEQDAKRWEEFGKSMEKRFGEGSEFEKGMKAWGDKYGKEMEAKFGPNSKFSKEMRAFEMKDGKMRELSEKEHEQMMKELGVKLKSLNDIKMPKMPDMPKMDGKAFVMPRMPEMPSNSFHSSTILDVAKTLSPAQREKNKKQGFLYWSDLTKEQQAKVGPQNLSGDWTITINRNGESFTLKSDKK